MKKMMKKLFSVLLGVAVVLSFSVTAFAGDADVTFTGKQDLFNFQPGSEYTDTDLFSNFKGVMPGDTLTQPVKITNTASDCDYIKVYLKAVPHDAQTNPLSKNVEAAGETVETMAKFLSQMTLTVKNGDQTIYSGSASEAGTLAEGVFLGQLAKNQSLNLNAQLSVPINMGNEFTNRAGEVDWVFKVEAFDYPVPPTTYNQLTVRKVWDGDNAKDRPSQVTVNLLKDGKVEESQVLSAANQWTYTWGRLSRWNKWSVEEVNVPEGYTASYETIGNTTVITNTRTVEPENITVRKIWKGDSKNRPAYVKVNLYRDGQVYKTAALKKSNNWTFTWKDLDQKYTWNVKEVVPKGYKAVYKVKGSDVTITNILKKDLKPVSLTVKKAWDDNDSDRRPDSVKVTLYNGKKAVEAVHLGEWNNWTYTWDDLDADGDWKVVEDQVPKGYVPSYKVKKGVVTVTNTAKLIQTGQLNWPVAVFGGLGIIVLAAGLVLILKGRKKENA